jgi:hypothetical protein
MKSHTKVLESIRKYRQNSFKVIQGLMEIRDYKIYKVRVLRGARTPNPKRNDYMTEITGIDRASHASHNSFTFNRFPLMNILRVIFNLLAFSCGPLCTTTCTRMFSQSFNSESLRILHSLSIATSDFTQHNMPHH